MCEWVEEWAKEWVIDCLTLNEQFVMVRTSYIRWDDDDVHFVLDQHSELNLYSASSLKQCADRLISPLRHIILIQDQPIYALIT
jgi:hypothetical protein